MKRIVAIILAVIMLLPTFSYGEEFILRNGIQFGDAMEDVREKETQLTFKEQDEDEEYSSLIYTGTISGIEDSTAIFKFSDGKLRVIVYELGESYKRDAASGMWKEVFHSSFVNQFNDITSALTAKYGSPTEENYGFYGDTMDSLLNEIVFSSLLGKKLDYDDMRNQEWLMKVDNGYVKIDNVYTEKTWWGRDGSFDHTLEYTFIPESEFNEKVQTEIEDALNHEITLSTDI